MTAGYISQPVINIQRKVPSMKSSMPMRIWFAFFGIVIFAGIYLTGFSNVHWLLYVPAAGMIFAAITGFCPSQITILKLTGSK